MAVLDFFKKKDPEQDDAANQAAVSGVPVGSGAPAQSDVSGAPGTVQVTQQTTQAQTSTTGVTGQSYNGIGNPPGGKAYNGIGAPPAAQAPVTTQSAMPVDPSATVGAASNTVPSAAAPQAADSQAPADATKTPDPTKPTDANKVVDGADPKAPDATKAPGAEDNALKSNIDQKKRTELDLMTHLTQRSNRVFVSAQQKAKELGSEFVDSEHVLHGLLVDPEIYKLFTEQKIPPQIIDQELEKLYQKGTSQVAPQPSPRVKRILENALVIARKVGYEFISPEHILIALYDEGEGVGARTLAKLGAKKEDLNKKILGDKKGLEGDKKTADGKSSQSALQQYTTDLTEKAAQGKLDPVVERSEVIERVIHIISRRTKNNPSLVGEAGVGKTAIVEGLAQKIVKKEVPESLLSKKILQLDLMSIIAGASHRGEFEERMQQIIEEVTQSQGQIIMFIDEIHNLVGAGAGGEGALDASNFLKPALARGELQVIGATTLTEYRKYIEKDPALERRFQPVLVPEPTPEAAIKMLKALKDKYEAFHRVKIPDNVIEVAVNLSKRYVGDRFLPDKAIDLIDEAGAAVRLPLISLPEEIRSVEERQKQLKQELEEVEKRGDRVKASILKPKLDDLDAVLKDKQDEYNTKKGQTTSEVTEQIIKDVISRWTGIPISKINDSETDKLKRLEDIIHERLINQENAVTPVAQAVRRGRAGLKSNKRPIGSFVFLGPTGVGKTELAKTLAEVLFGQEEAMIRFDMTEFMEKHEVAKLLGAPPGYVGYEEGGKLTEAVRRKPYSVVLFDEVEKAHPDIFNILLQILDDGRLTDNKGHVISFKNTVVICTSNIGTKMIQDDIMAGGKVDIEEPTILSTYAFSPRGRQVMTIMGKVFEREDANSQWMNKMIIDYFAGQKVEVASATPGGAAGSSQNATQGATADGVNPTDSQSADQPVDAVGTPVAANSSVSKDGPAFPGKEFETHAMSPKGVEMITVGETLYQRTSTTAKVWNVMSLIEYFKNGIVINALPDAPEEQLPTAKLKTHAFTPQEMEVVSYRDRFWKRKDGDNNWETGTLKDYFEGQTLDQKEDVAPSASADTPKAEGQAADQVKPKDDQKKPIVLPVNYWDIHTFSPDGKELIIVGERIWIKEQNANWKTMTLNEYFGKDFPLDKELDEKKKIEDELAENQYGRIKAKVMDELRKFFRPELINRFDEVIVFEPLKYQHMLLIVELQLKELKKLLEEQNIGFSSTPSAGKEIVRQGFDPLYGARPLKRTIQVLIENPISTLIIEKKVGESDMIVVDFDGENFVFNIEKTKMVPVSELNKKKVRKFMCVESRHEFETETSETATVICPINAKEKVQELVDDVEEKAEDKSAADTGEKKEAVPADKAEVAPAKPEATSPKTEDSQPKTTGDKNTQDKTTPPPVVN